MVQPAAITASMTRHRKSRSLRVRHDRLPYETGIKSEALFASSQLLSSLTSEPVQANKAIVGRNAFAHEAGIHQDGLLKDTATYQIMDPGELGLAMTLPLGKHSGRHAFARACEDAGVHLEAEELASAFARFKELADTGRAVSVEDVVEAVGAR